MAETHTLHLAARREIGWRHEVALRHRAGSLELDVAFTLRARWTALFAPSGAGKSTVLRLIAGLDRPDAGRVVLQTTWPPQPEVERVLTDVAAGISVVPERRGIGLVAQRAALFPHKSVLENVSYGVFGGRDREEAAEARAWVESVCRLCRVEHLTGKRPWQLSGGERQRVALARTLAARPSNLLLLDEPFGGLDSGLRAELIVALRAHLEETGTPVLLVTHDVGEVFATGAEVLRMEGGRVVSQGPAAEVLEEERRHLRAVLARPDERAGMENL